MVNDARQPDTTTTMTHFCVPSRPAFLLLAILLFLLAPAAGASGTIASAPPAGTVTPPQPPAAFSSEATGSPFTLAWSMTDSEPAFGEAWGDYDNDGDLDLAVGNYNAPLRLYRNDDGVMSAKPTWSTPKNLYAQAVAWGDYDRDRDLDLAVAICNGPSLVFRNDNGVLADTAVWSTAESGCSSSIAWGDYNADGFVDLAVGNIGAPNRVYWNDHSLLVATATWSSTEADTTNSVVWMDYDHDGDLDLAAGNSLQPSRLYRNDGGTLTASAVWSSVESSVTNQVASGDYDGDGDFDLAVANSQAPVRLYRNDGGALTPAAAWSSNLSDQSQSVAWGDFDRDGDLDLAVGNRDQPNRVYRNDGGVLTGDPVWSSAEADDTVVAAWADYDGDGDLDLLAGNYAQPSRVYRNDLGTLDAKPVWSSLDEDVTMAVAWGDSDGDGDLDLAVGNGWDSGQPNRVYHNHDGVLNSIAGWSSLEADRTWDVAWGDVDGDGDLDLAVANVSGPNRLYRNDAGVLTDSAAWSSTESDASTAIAWGDYDGDGDLDLAVANQGQPVRLYSNNNGALSPSATWSAALSDYANDVAWGDYDRDGDLDLAVAVNSALTSFRVYRNDAGLLERSPAWSSSSPAMAGGIAWGDLDKDGDLDIAEADDQHTNRVFRNDEGKLISEPVWTSIEADRSTSVAWGDYDGDGDLDLAVGNLKLPSRLYRNDRGVLTPGAAQSFGTNFGRSVAWGDFDNDGDLDLAVGTVSGQNQVYENLRINQTPFGLAGRTAPTIRIEQPGPTAKADFYSTPAILPLSGTSIPIRYTVAQVSSRPVAEIRAYYSPDGGGKWLPAVPSSDTQTTNLETSPTGVTYTYTWDVLGSGFLGQSDNVVFRMVAVPTQRQATSTVPGPFFYGSTASDTFPFRVRGVQVRVMENGKPVAGALVYRRPQNSSEPAGPVSAISGEPFTTDAQGYLQGRGTLVTGDRLYALAPATNAAGYTLYHTNAVPTVAGLDGYTVAGLGLQTLQVSAAHPLILFDLDISLEWDARNDAQFLSQLKYDLQRTSELLFDWSNGQAALGKLTVHQDRELWEDAHIRIYATNRLRPSAVQGGIVSVPRADPGRPAIVYYPGQLYIGATWNRYGNAGSSLDEDWPRTLAHELGHYALYLQDNYLGRDDLGRVIPVDGCSGAMADPYRDDAAPGYGEFHAAAGWLPLCALTLSNRDTGRADWSTIKAFYPQLDALTENPGPSTLPLAVTKVTFVEPAQPTTALKDPIFLLSQDGQRQQPGSTVRAFLYRGGWATDLGRPMLDQLLARGAQPGDRVCLYEPSAGRLGCETVTAGDEELVLVARPGWQPNIQVSPVTSRTLTLSVSGVPAGLSLKARLYPADRAAGAQVALTASGSAYATTFTEPLPTFQGLIQVWVDEAEPRREAVVDFTLGGNPSLERAGAGGKRSAGAHQRSGGAPLMSADGQVILFAPDVSQPTEWFYILQAAPAGLQPPPWATSIGQAYRLSATPGAPDLAGSSLSFSYLGSEVPPGEEDWLKLYFYDGSQWQPLATNLDTYHNLASAPTRGPGLYALMSSIEIPLDTAGWNTFGYPVHVSQPVPVPDALISVTGFYTTVYSYEPADTADPWKLYDVTVPAWVNDLAGLEFGHTYWINVSQALVLKLKGASTASAASADSLSAAGPSLPPATYYGKVRGGGGLTPAAGVPVTAYIGDRVCGRSTTREVAGTIVYSVSVEADGPAALGNCGKPGEEITFAVGDQRLPATAQWDNNRVTRLNLGFTAESYPVYVPLILRAP